MKPTGLQSVADASKEQLDQGTTDHMIPLIEKVGHVIFGLFVTSFPCWPADQSVRRREGMRMYVLDQSSAGLSYSTTAARAWHCETSWRYVGG